MSYKRLSKIPWQIVNERAVIIDPQNNKIHELDNIATDIWSCLDGKQSAAEIAEHISGEYSVEEAMALSDVEEFCESLFHEGLLEKDGE